MRSNRSRDTKPELRLRRELYRRGYRYRVNSRPVPDLRIRADIVFRGRKVAIFVDGCFWHGCPEHYRPAVTRAIFWSEKITTNQARDRCNDAILQGAGWTVMRVWEHEPVANAVDRIIAILAASRSSP